MKGQSVNMRRVDGLGWSSCASSSGLLRGSAKSATMPNKNDVIASPQNRYINDFSASKPPTAGPTVKPVLIASRYSAKAVTRCP